MTLRMRDLRRRVSLLIALNAELRTIAHERRSHSARIPRGPVLEIGGGQSPHRRSDVVVEKHLVDHTERPGELAVSVAKPLVVADGHHLPFADGAFAYVIAAHVIEHVADPHLFAGEMSRVGAAGFVQVPSPLAERVFGWAFHAWQVDIADGRLQFEPKTEDGQAFDGFFHAQHAESFLFRSWWEAHRSYWLRSLEWEGSLQVVVRGTPPERSSSAEVDVDRTIEFLRSLDVRGPSPGLLRCPACLGQLRRGADHLSCVACDRRYPVVGSVPLLLEEAAS